MRAAQIEQFGPPEVIQVTDLPKPSPGDGQLVVRTHAAGVGPWDALIRSGISITPSALQPPLILCSDLSGIVDSVGPGVDGFKPGDEIYGVANESFTDASAEYAVVKANMVALKPHTLDFLEAASAPVVAVTAYQMLFEYAHLKPGQTALIHGAAGNVGAYAVQLAKNAGINVIATASAKDLEYVRALGADQVIDYKAQKFEDGLSPVDAVLDMVGGDTRERSLEVLKSDGTLVTIESPMPEEDIRRYPNKKIIFFLVEVTTARLNTITQLFEAGKLRPDVGSVLPLAQVQEAHKMLAGAPHKRGKILLQML